MMTRRTPPPPPSRRPPPRLNRRRSAVTTAVPRRSRAATRAAHPARTPATSPDTTATTGATDQMAAKTADPSDFLSKVEAVARAQGRYSVQAYLFVFEALEFTLNRVGQRRHITGQELLSGLREFALNNFGRLGRAVFNQWGITETRDFGRIVFALVEAGLMSKTATDSLDDFADGFDFAQVFEDKYTPSSLHVTPPRRGKRKKA